jgi:hypothetical protein
MAIAMILVAIQRKSNADNCSHCVCHSDGYTFYTAVLILTTVIEVGVTILLDRVKFWRIDPWHIKDYHKV